MAFGLGAYPVRGVGGIARGEVYVLDDNCGIRRRCGCLSAARARVGSGMAKSSWSGLQR